MALNIGDISFGVEAQTAGLRKAVSQLERFKRAVDETAQSQVEGAKRAANAMARQESAVKRALSRVASLRSQLQSVDAPATSIARVSTAFGRLTREMTSGELSAIDFRRSMDAFNTTVGRSQRELRNLKVARKAQEVDRFNNVIRDLRSASVLAVGPLSGLGARIEALGAITSRSSLALAGFIGGVTGAAVGIGLVVREAVRLNSVVETMEARFISATGSVLAAGEELEFARDLAKELSLDIVTTSNSFANLAAAARGTVLEGEGVREVFKGVSQAAAALRLSAFDTQGAIRALEQIMSKGTVQAEELRGQLGERIPGAFRLAAKAMDVTTQELNNMLKAGEVLSEDFLPKFAQVLQEVFGPDAERLAESFTGAVNRLRNAWFDLITRLDEATGISNAVTAAVSGLAAGLQAIADNIDILVGAFGALAGAMIGLGLSAVVANFGALVAVIRAATAATWAFTAALAANPLGAMSIVLVRLGVALAGGVAGFKLLSAAARDSFENVEDLNEQVTRLIDLERELGAVGAQAQKATLRALEARRSSIEQRLSERRTELFQVEREVGRLTFQGLRTQGPPPAEAAESRLRMRAVERLQRETAAVRELQKEYEGVQDQIAVVGGMDVLETTPLSDFSEDASTGADRVGDFITKLLEARNEVRHLQMIMDDPALTQSAEALQRALTIEDIRQDIAALSTGEIIDLRDRLNLTATSARGMAEELSSTFVSQKRLKEETNDLLSALEKQPETLQEINDELAKMRMETAALQNLSPEGFEIFSEMASQAEKVERWRIQLDEANVSIEMQRRLLGQLRNALAENAEARKEFQEFSEDLNNLESAFQQSMSSLGNSVVTLLRIGEQETLNFRDIMVSVVNDIIEAFLRLSIIEPFLESLSGMLRQRAGGGGILGTILGISGGGGGGGIGFMSQIATSAQGNVFTRPSLTAVGEGGGPEAVLPLTRGSGGNLGVRAEGFGGTSVVVNVINEGGRALQSQGQSTRRNPDGTLVVDVMVKSSIERLDAQGQLDGVFQRHGAPRRGQF